MRGYVEKDTERIRLFFWNDIEEQVSPDKVAPAPFDAVTVDLTLEVLSIEIL